MITVQSLLRVKGSDVWSVAPNATIRSALEVMAEKDIGALLVVEDKKVRGIFSERDYAREVLKKEVTLDTPVSAVMTADVITITPEHTIEDCMQLMTKHRIRHLPVLDNGRLCGVISIGDVVKTTINDRENMIRSLEHYIEGTGYGQY